MIPLRLLVLPRIFTPLELNALDGDGSMNEATGSEPDFYEEAHTVPSASSTANIAFNNSSIQLLRIQSTLNPNPKV